MEKSNGKILSILLTAFVVLSAQLVQAQFCSVVTQDIDCNGEQTGIITFNSSGGTAPYSYAWSHDATFVGNEASNLPAGLYSITVTDAVGVEEICSVELFQPTAITITNVIEVDPMCGMMDGSLEIIAVPQSGGALSDLMYSIDGGMTFQSSNIFSNLGADDYLIIIADANGCFIVESRQLVDATTVIVNLTSSMCEPGGTIAIDIEPSGGTLPYDYLWSNGAITQDISGAPQGSYTVIVTDREGCSAEGSYTVDNCCDTSMFCTANVTEISCAGGSDGEITIVPTGGSGIYSYAWDNGATTATVQNLGVGFYNVTVTDDTGCESICGVAVTEPTAIIIADITSTNSNCGAADGTLTVTATPQSNSTLADLVYSIDGVTTQISNNFTGLSAGSYTVVVTDSNGCSASMAASVADSGGLSID